MQVSDLSLADDQQNELTSWAVLRNTGFVLGDVDRKLRTMRLVTDQIAELASAVIRHWKAAGKIKFVKGRWQWVFRAQTN